MCLKKAEAIRNSLVNHMAQQLVGCTITTDAWTSNATESFLGMTCHYIDKSFNLLSVVLNLKCLGDSHTASFINSTVSDCLKDWNLENKVFFIDLMLIAQFDSFI